MATMLKSPRVFGVALLLGCSLASSFAESSFTGLGSLMPRGLSSGDAISRDGSTVVGGSDSSSGWQTFRWTATSGMVGLGYLRVGSHDSQAYGVSGDGKVVVGSDRLRSGHQASRWTATGGMVGLGYLAGGSNSVAKAISADSSVIVGESMSASGMQAFRWTAAHGMVGLGYLPCVTNNSSGTLSSNGTSSSACIAVPTGSSASAVSDDGLVVVGGSDSKSNYQAFRWTATSGMVGLGKLPGSDRSEATAVSGDGSVVVGVSDMGMVESYSSCEPFRWTADGGMIGLGHLHGWRISEARAVSSDGLVVVGWHGFGTAPYNEAFIWDSVNGMRNLQSVLTKHYHLNLTGWELQSAWGISADRKTIAGTGVHKGRNEAWVARLDRPVNEAGGKKERK